MNNKTVISSSSMLLLWSSLLLIAILLSSTNQIILVVDATRTIYVDNNNTSPSTSPCGTTINNACTSLWGALNSTTSNDTDITLLLAPGIYSGINNIGLIIYNISITIEPIPSPPSNTTTTSTFIGNSSDSNSDSDDGNDGYTVIIMNDNNNNNQTLPFIIIPPIFDTSSSSNTNSNITTPAANTTITINSIQFKLNINVGANGSLINGLITTTNTTTNSSTVSITLYDSLIQNANVEGYGGVISLQPFLPVNATPPSSYAQSTVSLVGSTFTNCSSQSSGGVIYSSLPNTYIISTLSTFHQNAAYNGSAIYIEYGQLTMNESIVYNHTSLDFNSTVVHPYSKSLYLYGGGSIYLYMSQFNIVSSTFTKNNHINGGAILLVGNNEIGSSPSSQSLLLSSSLYNCTLTDNHALVSGGAISISLSSNISIVSSNFSDNVVISSGGSLFTEYVTNISISNSFFQNDQAYFGGSICLNSTNQATIIQVGIDGNDYNNNNHHNNNHGSSSSSSSSSSSATSIREGGAIFMSSSNDITVNFTTITNNYADMGASIYCSKTTLLLSNNTYTNNSDGASTKNQIDNLFCGTLACTITNLDQSPLSHKCRTIEVISPKRLPSGLIVGIVVGCVLGSFLIFLVIVMVIRTRAFSKSLKPLLKKSDDNSGESQPNNDIDEE